MLDIGASTGGFTDCALQNGAAFVYAVDVGTTNWTGRCARTSGSGSWNGRIPSYDRGPVGRPAPAFATIDVSFISLKLILPTLAELLQSGGGTVALIKPQFEAGREQVGKSGVVGIRAFTNRC
ncbi:SAM-dependent methyltransferase [Cohnella algarum]|uniref:SAM-dependent methyltransferase n=1 Tax=Cohnella algarum TaxID=2044859 RepID=UPI001F072921|nr:SAM-dependent methyltransferase [Cohnella algarum]